MYNTTFRERPQRTNKPMHLKNGENKMELKECITCGSHNFTNGKCDYCGNQYEVKQGLDEERETLFDNIHDEELTFQETPAGKTLLKIMIYILVAIIWFAVTVFIPPLFIITIILLVIYVSYRLTKRIK